MTLYMFVAFLSIDGASQDSALRGTQWYSQHQCPLPRFVSKHVQQWWSLLASSSDHLQFVCNVWKTWSCLGMRLLLSLSLSLSPSFSLSPFTLIITVLCFCSGELDPCPPLQIIILNFIKLSIMNKRWGVGLASQINYYFILSVMLNAFMFSWLSQESERTVVRPHC